MFANRNHFFAAVCAAFCLLALCGCATRETEIAEETNPDVKKISVLIGGAPEGDIYEKLIRCTRKKDPAVLIFCTGWNDAPDKIREELANFTPLTARAEAVRLSDDNLTEEVLAQKIRSADLIYIAGGNAARIFQTFQDFPMKELLEEAHNRGAVLVGTGPGAAVLCYSGYNLARNGRFNLRKGLAILPFHFCYEYQRAPRKNFDRRLSWENSPPRGYALTAGAALFCVNDNSLLYKFTEDAQAFQFTLSERFWRKSELKTRREAAAEAKAKAAAEESATAGEARAR